MQHRVRRLALLAIVFSPVCAAANPGVVPLNSLKLNGWAYLLSSNYIRLTNDGSQASSAFVPTPFPFGPNDSFGALFVYQSQEEAGQCAADGLAFVAENAPAGPGYLGQDGSGLGFFTGTSSPAIGVTFDYYPNQITGTPANTTAIASPNGVDIVSTMPTPTALSGAGAFRFVWVAYQNATRTLQVFYNATATRPGKPMLTATLSTDLSSLFGGQAYFGITAGTGTCYTQQKLMYLSLDVVNVP